MDTPPPPSRRGRPPDWLIYGGIVVALAIIALARKEHADAPPAPPPMNDAAVMDGPATVLAAGASFKSKLVKPTAEPGQRPISGTAFSISDTGVWLTARHVVKDCGKAVVMVSRTRGVMAKVFADKATDVAVLTTDGGAPPLPMALGLPLTPGQRVYLPGFPQDRAGEAAARFIGPDSLNPVARGSHPQPVMVWAEAGRTAGLKGSLAGLSGAPVLDSAGRVVGVTLAEAPRRGRIYSATSESIRAALTLAGQKPSGFARGQPITVDNYGRTADTLRRDLRVAQVVCLS
jgi:S1-C subfamily serine protease